MKFWEAMKALQAGLAVKRIDLNDPLLPSDIDGSEYEADIKTEWELYPSAQRDNMTSETEFINMAYRIVYEDNYSQTMKLCLELIETDITSERIREDLENIGNKLNE